jgi:putative addiction module component (TIGR02574 family)
MPYNKEELLKLSVEEKLQLIEDLIASVNEEEEDDEEELLSIAKERYEQYLKNPNEGISWEEFRSRVYNKYNF